MNFHVYQKQTHHGCCNAQNVHPILPHYQQALVTESMSHDAISMLLNPSNETQLMAFLQG